MPEDGNRYEAIEGDLYMTPVPRLHHQTISLRLEVALVDLLVKPGRGRLWHAPVSVEFPATGEGVQPDIVFVSNERRGIVATAGLVGPPDLVVEILSPATAARDCGIKLRLYEREGVAEYWIVDADEAAIEVWRFGAVPVHERFTDAIPVRLGDEFVGVIALPEVFLAD